MIYSTMQMNVGKNICEGARDIQCNANAHDIQCNANECL